MATLNRFAALVISASTALTTHAGQFQDLFALAQTNDPSYLAAQHTLDANLQILPQANSAIMPTISGSYSQNLALDERSNSHNYGIQVALPLRLDAYYGLKIAEQSAAGANVNFEKTHQNLIFTVIDRYIAVLKQQNQLFSTMAELAAIEQRIEQTNQQVELGLSTILELQDLEANLQQLQVGLLQVEQNLSLARADLENLTNDALPEQLDSLSTSYSATNLVQNDSLENWFRLAQIHNLDLAMNNHATQQAFHNYQAKDVGLYPKGSVTLSQNYSAMSGETQTLSVGITGTFYDGGLNLAQTKEAKEAWYASQERGNATLKATQQELRRWHQAVETSQKQIAALAKLNDALEASLEGKNTEYQLGLRDISDILDAEKLVFSGQRDWANARLDLVLNQLRLKKATGILSTADLETLDQWFQ